MPRIFAVTYTFTPCACANSTPSFISSIESSSPSRGVRRLLRRHIRHLRRRSLLLFNTSRLAGWKPVIPVSHVVSSLFLTAFHRDRDSISQRHDRCHQPFIVCQFNKYSRIRLWIVRFRRSTAKRDSMTSPSCTHVVGDQYSFLSKDTQGLPAGEVDVLSLSGRP